MRLGTRSKRQDPVWRRQQERRDLLVHYPSKRRLPDQPCRNHLGTAALSACVSTHSVVSRTVTPATAIEAEHGNDLHHTLTSASPFLGLQLSSKLRPVVQVQNQRTWFEYIEIAKPNTAARRAKELPVHAPVHRARSDPRAKGQSPCGICPNPRGTTVRLASIRAVAPIHATRMNPARAKLLSLFDEQL